MAEIDREFRKQARFLIDESLPTGTKGALDVWGFASKTVFDVGLEGRSDEDIFAYAWKTKYYILSADTDFLDDSRFPNNRNPGVIIIPSFEVGTDSFIESLYVAVTFHGHYEDVFRHTKVLVHKNGEFSVWQKEFTSSSYKKHRYKLEASRIYEWIE